MALVVLLRGVNVCGHKTFRPRQFADDLKSFDVVNIGAAGTFVVREKVIRYLGKTDREFDTTVTTRNWNTIETIARVLTQ